VTTSTGISSLIRAGSRGGHPRGRRRAPRTNGIALAFFGSEGFEEALAELSREEIAAVFGEAVDALMDAETKHEKEMRKLAERLQR
jgi:hypothetical protein